jgi:protein-disulfide isomerase
MEEWVNWGANNSNNMLMGIIIFLLIIIAVMGFFLGKQQWGIIDNNNNSETSENSWKIEDLTVTIIDDKRCTNCNVDLILESLNKLPSIESATIVKKDFSDEWVEQILKDNKVTKLPLIIFSTKNFDISKDPKTKDPSGNDVKPINTFLQELPSGEFYLEVWSKFDPFKTRSENWFLVLDKEVLKTIKDNSYIKWNTNSKITWIEYSDLECPYCAKLHNAGTSEELVEKYGEDLSIIFNHFPLGFHANAQVWAEILECLGEQKWSDAFYSLMVKAFKEEKSDKSFLIEESVVLWADEKKIKKCLDDEKYTEKVKQQMARWSDNFGISWTPWNILINNETWEYEVISGAYPTDSFVEIIDRLLK